MTGQLEKSLAQSGEHDGRGRGRSFSLLLRGALPLAICLTACVSKDPGWESSGSASEGADFGAVRSSLSEGAPESEHQGWSIYETGDERYGKHGNGMEFVASRLRPEEEALVLVGPATIQLPSGRQMEVPAGSEVSLRGGELFFDSVPIEEGRFAIPLE